MSQCLRLGLIIAAAVSSFTSIAAQKAGDVPIEILLQRVAAYLTGYEKSLASVVLEEHYTQALQPKGGITFARSVRRELASDVISVLDPVYGWTNFRDVFAVDNTPVRDRDQRLQKLFLSPAIGKADALSKARVIADEGGRFNLGAVSRNVNVPTMALTFLSATNQPRLKFKRSGTERIGGIETVKVEFEEVRRPSIVRSGNLSLPALGAAWIEPASGRVMKTDLQFDARDFTGRIIVTYALVEKVKLWLPASMNDTVTGPVDSVRGVATYTNVRQFGVSTNAVIK
jgi:hypothetical protein